MRKKIFLRLDHINVMKLVLLVFVINFALGITLMFSSYLFDEEIQEHC